MVALKSEEPDAMLWSVQPERGGNSQLLWELFPDKPLTAGPAFDSAVAVANGLEQGAQLGLQPIEEFWVEKGCLYALEEEPPALSLAQLPQGRLAADKAEAILKNLSRVIFTCASATPPMLHGAIGPDAVRFRSWEQPPVLVGSKALREVLRKGQCPSPKDVLAADLPALGYTLLGAVSGEAPGKLAQDNGLRKRALLSISPRSPLGAILNWYMAGGRFLPSDQKQLERFEKRIGEGLAAWKASRYQEARTAFNAALKDYGSSLVEQEWLPAIDKEEAQEQRRLEETRPKAAAPPPPLDRAPAPSPVQAPPPPAPPQPTSAPVGDWRCLHCGAMQFAEARFCPGCGTQRGAKGPAPSPAPVAASAPASSPDLPAPNTITQPPSLPTDSASTSSPKGKGGAFYGGLALAVALVIGIVWYANNSEMRNFNQAIESGRLISPTGNSAYDLYRAELLKNGGKSTSLSQEMAKDAKPQVAKLTDTAFTNWYRNSRLADTIARPDQSGRGMDWNVMLQNMTWADLAKGLGWLVEIEPNPVLRARQAYAEGQAAMSQNHPLEARNQFMSALRFNPDWDMAYSGIGRSYALERRWDETERYYKEAIRVSPAWVFPRQNLAELFMFNTKRLAEAEEQARAAVSIDSNRPGSHEILGRALYFEQKYPEACSELNRALQLSSQVTPSPFNISRASAMRDKACQRAR